MDARIHTTLQKSKFDLVIASQLTMASYFPSFQTVPAIFEEMELGSFYEAILRETSMSKHFRARLTWLKLQKYVSKLLRNFNAGTVASARELNIIEQHLPAHRHKIEVLPNGLDLQDYQNIKVSRRPNHIIFSGSFSYIANYEAMQWFISRVFPLIIKKIPEVQLIITGDHANLPLPSMENVVLAGYVEDIKSLLASCDVSIAPIWSGGGTRLKILEAMALGTPVIATSKGAEGLMAQDGTHLLIADDPEKFAGYVIRLIQDEALRRKLASNAAQLVKDHYDWQTLMPQFLRLVEKTASG